MKTVHIHASSCVEFDRSSCELPFKVIPMSRPPRYYRIKTRRDSAFLLSLSLCSTFLSPRNICTATRETIAVLATRRCFIALRPVLLVMLVARNLGDRGETAFDFRTLLHAANNCHHTRSNGKLKDLSFAWLRKASDDSCKFSSFDYYTLQQ